LYQGKHNCKKGRFGGKKSGYMSTRVKIREEPQELEGQPLGRKALVKKPPGLVDRRKNLKKGPGLAPAKGDVPPENASWDPLRNWKRAKRELGGPRGTKKKTMNCQWKCRVFNHLEK